MNYNKDMKIEFFRVKKEGDKESLELVDTFELDDVQS